MSDEFVSVVQAAALLTVSPWTIRSWLTLGRLRRFKVGRRTVCLRSDVLGMVKLETGDEAAARNVEREQRRAKKGTLASPHPARTARKPRQQRVPSHT